MRVAIAALVAVLALLIFSRLAAPPAPITSPSATFDEGPPPDWHAEMIAAADEALREPTDEEIAEALASVRDEFDLDDKLLEDAARDAGF